MGELRDRMAADLRLRNLAPSTQAQYLTCVEKLGRFHDRCPVDMDWEEVRAFLVHLRGERGLSPSSQKIYVAALKFFFTVTVDRPNVMRPFFVPKVPKKLPQILSGREVEAVFAAVHGIKYRAVVMTMYGGGLRIGEACALHIADVDSKRMLLRIREAKGGRQRYTLLSQRLLMTLREYWKQQRPPGPYLFPARGKNDVCVPGATVRTMLRKAFEQCGLTKAAGTHIMRHSFATHLLESGTDIRIIQVLLGHRRIETTSQYTQVSRSHIARTKSPLDVLGTQEAAVLG